MQRRGGVKRVTVSGFKSFAERSTFTLSDGITGIVGPNGSGKSNVIDAVRWVMGEQNAKLLRGERVTDVIFAGSQKRQAVAMAEVSLTFDNTDGQLSSDYESEITLTRRIYLDGHKEQLINKTACRLRDLTEFFTVSDLSSKSYSLIQQGQVERILNAKPEDIREIIEEAAGTIIFRKRSSETEKKLANTNNNLARVDDLLTELSRQKSALSEQVASAKHWQTITAEYETVQQQLIVYQYRQCLREADLLERQLRLETKVETDGYRQLRDYQDQRNKLHRQLNDHDPQVTEIENAITYLEKNLAEIETQLVKLKVSKENAQQRLTTLAVDIEEAEQLSSDLETEVQGLQKRRAGLTEQLARLNSEQQTVQQRLAKIDGSASELVLKEEEFREEIASLTKANNSRQVSLEFLQRGREKIVSTIDKLQSRLDVVSGRCQELQEQERRLQREIDSKQSGLGGELNKKQRLEQAIEQLTVANDELLSNRDRLKEQYFARKARYDSASAEIDSDRAQFLVAEDQKLGLVGEYLRFADNVDELPTPMVKAVERWAERVVVDNLAEFASFGRLADSDRDIALVIASCRLVDERQVDEWRRRFALSPLTDYLAIDRQLPVSVVSRVLNVLHVTFDLQMPEELSATMPDGVVLFTPQGGWLTRGGEATVAARRGKPGMISRQRVVDELQLELKVSQDELTAVQATLDANSAQKASHILEVKTIADSVQGENQQLAKILANYQTVAQQLAQEQQLVKEVEGQQKEQQHELAVIGDNIDAERQTQQSLTVELRELEQDFADIKASYADYQQQRQGLADRDNSLQVQIVKIGAEVEALNKEIQLKTNSLDNEQQRLLRYYSERDLFTADIEQADSDRQRYRQASEELVRTREEKSVQLLTKREGNQKIILELKKVETNVAECQREQDAMQKSIYLKTADKDRIDKKRQELEEQATEFAGLELDNYPLADGIVVEELLAKRQKLKETLAELGAVNMLALEEYDKLVAREEFVVQQRQELCDSIDLLRQAMTEIEQTSVKRFNEVFAQVAKEFEVLFPVLFPKGQATLVIDNVDDPLSSGVQVMVQLPGKKRQHMNLFSGGEKALTAISLIFSLLKTKPTPFCFLDEVDAALDEANVARFNRVLQQLSREFQFVIVTHNRKTMEVFDRIYGVTMQEPGVSKVVGIDFDKTLPTVLRKESVAEASP